MLQTIKKHQFLLEELVKRDFGRKYKGAFFGAGWSVMNPLLTLFIMRMVFGHFFSSGIPHYIYSTTRKSSPRGLSVLARVQPVWCAVS